MQQPFYNVIQLLIIMLPSDGISIPDGKILTLFTYVYNAAKIKNLLTHRQEQKLVRDHPLIEGLKKIQKKEEEEIVFSLIFWDVHSRGLIPHEGWPLIQRRVLNLIMPTSF